MKTIGRKDHRKGVSLFVNKIVGDEPHLALARDISAGGLYLHRLLEPTEIDPNTVGLEIRLPDDDHVIWAVGEVIRDERKVPDQDAAGVAVRFTHISESDRQRIRTYVRAQSIHSLAA